MFILSKLTRQDRSLFEKMVFNHTVMTMNYGRIFTADEATSFWQHILSQNEGTEPYGYYKVLSDHVFLGIFGLTNDGSRVEVEYMFLPEYWGRGYATALLAQQIAFLRDTGVISLIRGITDPGNIPSIKVLEKNGFTFVETRENPDNDPIIIFELDLSVK